MATPSICSDYQSTTTKKSSKKKPKRLITDYFRQIKSCTTRKRRNMTDHGKSLNPVLIESDEDSGKQMTKANLNKKIKVEGGEACQPSVRGVTELDKEKLILAVWESKKNGLCNSGGPITNEWPRVISRYNAMGGRPHEITKLRKNTWKSIKDNWRKFYDLSNMTGVKFNKEEGYVDMEDSWWESIIEADPKYKSCWGTKCPLYMKLFDILGPSTAQPFKPSSSKKKGKRVAESEDDEEEIGSNKRSTTSRSTKDLIKSVGISKLEIDSEYTSLCGKRTDLKLNSQKMQSSCIQRLAAITSITGEERAIVLEHVAKDDNLKITLLGLDDESLTSWIKLIAFERKNAITKQRF